MGRKIFTGAKGGISRLSRQLDYDIAIIGCGASGTAAALAAAEAAKKENHQLNIVILERADFENRGGNSRWTASYMRMQDIDTPAPNFVEDMLAFSEHYGDRKYIETLHENAGQTLRWVESKGVAFEYLPTMFLTSSKPRLLPVGGGRALIDTLSLRARALNVEIIYEATVWDLQLSENGAVESIKVRMKTGETMTLLVGAVVMASGGFQGNREMMSQYIGHDAHKIPPVAEGGLFNKGEAIRMALKIGAKGGGQWDAFHAEPVDPRSKREEAGVMTYPYAILVNLNGERFTDEGETTIDEQYEAVARKIFYDCPNHIAYMITDQKLYDIPNYEDALQTEQPPITANTIKELAVKLSIPAEALQKTVSEFNAAVQPGEFKWNEVDGKKAVGITPVKSNWAIEIDKGPYIAYPIICCNVFTNGGIATDNNARVLSNDDAPIPGLYAAGEMTGLYYGKYPGGTSVLRCLVYGKRAGENAVHYLTNQQAFS